MNPLYPAVSARAGHVCEYCHAPEIAFNLPFEIEHIVPVADGGAITLNNLALSCRSCNLYKSDFTRAMDELERRVVALFNPRQDKWPENFTFIPATGEMSMSTIIDGAAITINEGKSGMAG